METKNLTHILILACCACVAFSAPTQAPTPAPAATTKAPPKAVTTPPQATTKALPTTMKATTAAATTAAATTAAATTAQATTAESPATTGAPTTGAPVPPKPSGLSTTSKVIIGLVVGVVVIVAGYFIYSAIQKRRSYNELA